MSPNPSEVMLSIITILTFVAILSKLAISDDLPSGVGVPYTPSNDKEWGKFITDGIVRTKRLFPQTFPVLIQLHPVDGEEISSPKYIVHTKIIFYTSIYGKVVISSDHWPGWEVPRGELDFHYAGWPELNWKVPPEMPVGPPVGLFEADQLSKAANFTGPYVSIHLKANWYVFATRAKPDAAWIVLPNKRVVLPEKGPVVDGYNITAILAGASGVQHVEPTDVIQAF